MMAPAVRAPPRPSMPIKIVRAFILSPRQSMCPSIATTSRAGRIFDAGLALPIGNFHMVPITEPAMPSLVTRFHLLLFGVTLAIAGVAVVNVPEGFAFPAHWHGSNADWLWPRD